MASTTTPTKKNPPPSERAARPRSAPPVSSAAAASKLSSAASDNPPRTGLDAWLQHAGRGLMPGGVLRLALVKGPALDGASIDPVDGAAPPDAFPAVLKFPASTVPPDFTSLPWRDGRLYQRNVPPPLEDSDDENGGGDDEARAAAAERKKRWKYNRVHAAKRQWILQEQVDFLETMLQRRQQAKKKKALPTAADCKTDQKSALSSRYEGAPERTASHYIIMSLATAPGAAATTTTATTHSNGGSGSSVAAVTVRTLPTPETTIAFCQPAARATMSLSQAELAIQDQRAGLVVSTRAPAAAGAAATGTAASGGGGDAPAPLRLPLRKKATTQSRLLLKLAKKAAAANNDEDDGDDVMADVAYRARKGGGGGARRELLATLGDGLAVSDEGVLGGGNDAAFGGRGQRFGQFQGAEQKGGGGGGGGASAERGADGAAMADDFYSRDVGAEYEDMDYAAADQFDDDDVDVGETEVHGLADGYGDEDDRNDDNDDDDDPDDGDDDDSVVGGAEGLATAAGFKALLAKARGDAAPAAAAAAANADAPANGGGGDERRSVSPKPNADGNKKKTKDDEPAADHMSKIMAAAEQSAQSGAVRKEKPRKAEMGTAAAAGAASTAVSAPDVDENGLRVITLQAVQREIWLHHGKIPINRLMKIFNAKKGHGPDRQSAFRDVVKELCTMTTDPVNGRTLVLKQHYCHMN